MAAARRRLSSSATASRGGKAALAALAALCLCACVAQAAAAMSSTTTSSSSKGGQSTSTSSRSTSSDGRPAVASASSTSNGGGGGGALPAPGQCVVASQSDGQACADGLCCQVRQEMRLCMPSWAKLDGSSAPPPPIPRALAAVGGGPAVPCCVLLADTSRKNALVPFCAADPYAENGAQKDAFIPLPAGAVVTRMTPECAAGPKAPGGFKFGTVACSVAFPPGTLPRGFAAPPGDFTAKAPLVAGVAGRAYPCAAAGAAGARAGASYGRLLQVASLVPAGQEGPDGEPAGTLRVTSKCE